MPEASQTAAPTESTGATAPAADGGNDTSFSSDMQAVIASGYEDTDSTLDVETPDVSGAGAGEQPAAPAAGAPATAAVVDPAASVPTAPQPAPAPSTPPAGQQQGQPPVAAPVDQPASVPQGATPPTAQPIDFAKHRDEYLPKFEQLYAIPAEEVEALRTNPEVALPKLAAKLHYEIATSLVQTMMSAMPSMLEQQMSAVQARTASNEKFYSSWPTLKEAVTKNPAAEGTIRSAIQAYRTANPQADLATVIKGAGVLAATMLGVPFEAAPPAPSTPPPPPPARPAGTGGPSPVAPARPGVTGSDIDEVVNSFMAGG